MSNQKYSEELKAHILAELESGASARSLVRKYEPSEATIRIWMRRAAESKLKESESMEEDESKIRRLERRNAQLEQENAFLKNAGLVRERQRDRHWWDRAYALIEAERRNFTVRLMCPGCLTIA